MTMRTGPLGAYDGVKDNVEVVVEKSTNGKQMKPYQQADLILQSQSAPVDKMRKLMSLGYDEEEAALLVEHQEIGTKQAVYYEQLPDMPYEPDELYWD